MPPNLDESLELDEIDLQYLEATRGPRLKSCALHQLDQGEELSPILWAELLKQDELVLRGWIESQTVDLAAPLHELLRRHEIKKKESISILGGYRTRLVDVMTQITQMKENYPDNPTLMEGVTIDTRKMSKGEVKQSKNKVLNLLHRPDVLNIRERRQSGLLHSRLGGTLLDAPGSTWEGTRYKNTLVVSLRKKLTLKIHFHALVHVMESKRNARQICEKYPRERSLKVLALCFRSLQLEWLHAKHVCAHAEMMGTMLVMQKYLYPAVDAVKHTVARKRHNQDILQRAGDFQVNWSLIHGYTSVERHHRIAHLQKGAANVAHASYFARHSNIAMVALHENRRLLTSLRNVNKSVHNFRLGTAGKKKLQRWWRVVDMAVKVRRDNGIAEDFLIEVQMRRPLHYYREYAQSSAQQGRASESGELLMRMKMLRRLLGSVLHYHSRRLALRKWRAAGSIFHSRKELSLAMHGLASRAQLCLYMKTCAIRGFHFYYSNAAQDCFETFKVRVKSGTLESLGREAAGNWNYQKAKRKGLHGLKISLALRRRATLLVKWSLERKLRARLALAYQAWIYAYVKRCTLRVALDKRLQHERAVLQHDPRARKKLERAADWLDEMHDMDRFHRGESGVQELEHSLRELRGLARAKLTEERTIDFGIIRMKLRAIRAIGAPQRRSQASSELNQSIEDAARSIHDQRDNLVAFEEGLSMYVHQYNKLGKSRHVADEQDTAFTHSRCRFDELITKDDYGIIRGVNTGPGVRASFVGPHITGREAVGTLVNSEIRAGMRLMESGLHKHYVDYTSHFNTHHTNYHEARRVPQFWGFGEAPHIRNGSGPEEASDTGSRSMAAKSFLPKPPTHPVGSHPRPPIGSGAGTPAAPPPHAPHALYSQPMEVTEHHAAGHPHAKRHVMHHARKVHHKVHDGETNRPHAGHDPDLIHIGKHEHHHAQKGLPHYMQTTNVIEMHAAGRVHHDPHMATHEDHTSASAHAHAGGLHAHHHASHEDNSRHHERTGVSRHVQESQSTSTHHFDPALPHKHSKPGQRTNVAEHKPASGKQPKRVREGGVSAAGAGDKQKRATKRRDYPTGNVNAEARKHASLPKRNPVPMRSPHSETKAEKKARKSLESEMVRSLPMKKASRYKEEWRHVQERHVRVVDSGNPPAAGHRSSGEDSDSGSDDYENPDVLRFLTRADLYRDTETSTDESDTSGTVAIGRYSDGYRHHTSHATSRLDASSTHHTSIFHDDDSVRETMERTAMTHIIKKMNDAKETPLLKFFRGAVVLQRARRPSRAAHADTEKSTYLEEEDEEAREKAKRVGTEKTQAALRDMSQYIADSGPSGAAGDTAAVGAALLERSMSLSYATNADISMRLERSFVSLEDEGSLGGRYGGSAGLGGEAGGLNTSGISLIEEDEDEDEVQGDVLGHNEHTLALFRDPSSRQRRKLEMFEVVNTLDDALRLVQETRWALAKLRRHALLTRNHRNVNRKNSTLRIQACLKGWKRLHAMSTKQLSLCDAIFARNAKAIALARLHYFGYTRLRKLLFKLTKITERNIKSRTTNIWWKKTRTLVNGHRVMRLGRQGVLRKRFGGWVWCLKYVPGMTAIRRKVTRRVCMPLLSRWRGKTVKLRKIRNVFTLWIAAWEDRLTRTVHRGDFLRCIDVWDCWRLYVSLTKADRLYRKKYEMAYLFRGVALTSWCFYAWIDFHVKAGATKRAARRKEIMTLRVCLDAMRDEARYVRLAMDHARQIHVSLLRCQAFIAWKARVHHRLYHSPRGHHRLTHFRLFFDEVRTMTRERKWKEILLPQQQRRKAKRMLAVWTALVIRRMRFRLGLSKLDNTFVGFKARRVLDAWPGRDSFAKGEAMRRQMEEKGRARMVLVDVDESEKRNREKERRKREEEEANKHRSFIQYRQRRPVQHRAQLLGIIYSMEDSHSVMRLFTLLRAVLLAWSDAAHTDRMLRGRHRLIMYRHKRFLVEHSLRVWMNRCSATSHRLALWIANKYSQHAHKTLAVVGSDVDKISATEHLIDTYSRMPAKEGESDPIYDDDDDNDGWGDGGWGDFFIRE